jgi:hypothetical protein
MKIVWKKKQESCFLILKWVAGGSRRLQGSGSENMNGEDGEDALFTWTSEDRSEHGGMQVPLPPATAQMEPLGRPKKTSRAARPAFLLELLPICLYSAAHSLPSSGLCKVSPPGCFQRYAVLFLDVPESVDRQETVRTDYPCQETVTHSYHRRSRHPL